MPTPPVTAPSVTEPLLAPQPALVGVTAMAVAPVLTVTTTGIGAEAQPAAVVPTI